jgi:hypothetical protein
MGRRGNGLLYSRRTMGQVPFRKLRIAGQLDWIPPAKDSRWHAGPCCYNLHWFYPALGQLLVSLVLAGASVHAFPSVNSPTSRPLSTYLLSCFFTTSPSHDTIAPTPLSPSSLSPTAGVRLRFLPFCCTVSGTAFCSSGDLSKADVLLSRALFLHVFLGYPPPFPRLWCGQRAFGGQWWRWIPIPLWAATPSRARS